MLQHIVLKEWASDIPQEYFGQFLDSWKKKIKNEGDLTEMSVFLKKHCVKWATWAVKDHNEG